jgi:CBS domain-containing protein
VETVRQVMTPRPCSCTPEDSVAAAARRMVLCDCGALPVVERARSLRVVGIVTDGDILRRVVAANLDPTATPVRQAMSGEVATLGPYATLEECAGLMAARRVGHVPIVDNTGTLLGIVARADLERGPDTPREAPAEESEETPVEPAAAG